MRKYEFNRHTILCDLAGKWFVYTPYGACIPCVDEGGALQRVLVRACTVDSIIRAIP